MLLRKAQITVGAFINKILNLWGSPLEKLEYLKEKKEEEHRNILDKVTTLQGNINQLEDTQEETKKSIDRSREAAKYAVINGHEDQAQKILENVVAQEATYIETEQYLEETKKNMDALKLKVKEYEAQISNINIEIEKLKMQDKISGVKLKIAESTSGLNMDTHDIQKNLKAGKDQVSAQNARAEAIMTLDAAGTYNALKGTSDVDQQIDSNLKQGRASEELMKLKAQIEAEKVSAVSAGGE